MLSSQRHLFDIPDDQHYLNCAYMSPLLNKAAEAGRQGALRKQQPWRLSPPDFFHESDKARALFGQLINANASDIAIIPSVSYGTAVATLNLPVEAKSKIIVLDEEFPSNLYSWRQIARQQHAEVVSIPRPDNNDWTSAVLDALDEACSIAVLPNTHWVDGGQLDLVLIGQKLREMGAKLVVDVTQSLGVLAVDIKAMQPDFLICATYKWLLGPYSLGFLYVAPAHQTGLPLEETWLARPDAENFARLIDYNDDKIDTAARFDMGERSNFASMPVAVAGLEQLHEWGQTEIESTLAQFSRQIETRLTPLGFSACESQFRSPHYLGMQHEKGLPDSLPSQLAAQNVYLSIRGDRIRITPHLYNNEADIDALVKTLDSACNGS